MIHQHSLAIGSGGSSTSFCIVFYLASRGGIIRLQSDDVSYFSARQLRTLLSSEVSVIPSLDCILVSGEHICWTLKDFWAGSSYLLREMVLCSDSRMTCCLLLFYHYNFLCIYLLLYPSRLDLIWIIITSSHVCYQIKHLKS